jgi:hypothetical protein
MVSCIAVIHMIQGDVEAASRVMEPYQDYEPRFDGTRLSIGELWVAMAKMRFNLMANNPEATVAMADPIYGGMHALHIVSFTPDLLLMKGRALIDLGQDDAARAALIEARDIAESHGIRRVLWEILAELAALEERAGRLDFAAELNAQAAEVLRYIEQRIKRPEFRASFLAQPQVRAVLERA